MSTRPHSDNYRNEGAEQWLPCHCFAGVYTERSECARPVK